MCRLTKQVREVDSDIFDDAVLIQYKKNDSVLSPDYDAAVAILHRLSTKESRWAFKPVIHIGDLVLTGAGCEGDIETVVRAAHYQFGADLTDYDYLGVNYCDNSFPKSLISSVMIQ